MDDWVKLGQRRVNFVSDLNKKKDVVQIELILCCIHSLLLVTFRLVTHNDSGYVLVKSQWKGDESRTEFVLISVCLLSIATLADTCTSIVRWLLSNVYMYKIMFRLILYDCMCICEDYVYVSIAVYSDVSEISSLCLAHVNTD